jgi:hypothetical protein
MNNKLMLRATVVALTASALMAQAADYTISADSTLQNGGFALTDGDSLTLNAGVTLDTSAAGEDAIFDDGARNLRIDVHGTVISNMSGDTDEAIDISTDDNVIHVHSGASLLAIDEGIAIRGINNELVIHAGSDVSGVVEGISISGDDNVIRIFGEVEATGTNNNDGLDVEGSGNTFYIGGTVRIPDGTCMDGAGECNALEIDEGNTVTLTAGARIIGGIQSSDGTSLANTLNINVGAAQSYVYTLNVKSSGQDWVVNDLDGRAMVSTSTLAAAAGVGNAEIADELMADRSGNLVASVGRLAAAGTAGQPAFDSYGMSQTRTAALSAPGYDLRSRGFTIGAPLTAFGRQALGIVNYHRAGLDISGNTHDIDTSSLRLGLVVPELATHQGFDLGIHAVAGRTSYRGTRSVLVNQGSATGVAQVNAGWNSTEAELGVTATTRRALSDRLSVQTSLGLAAQVERTGAYSEGSYFSWEGRTVVQGYARMEATVNYAATQDTRLYGAAGATRRNVISGKTARYSVNANALGLSGGQYHETAASLRVGLGHSMANGYSLSAEIGAIDSNRSKSTWGAGIGLMRKF